jgi:hypothetical protein
LVFCTVIGIIGGGYVAYLMYAQTRLLPVVGRGDPQPIPARSDSGLPIVKGSEQAVFFGGFIGMVIGLFCGGAMGEAPPPAIVGFFGGAILGGIVGGLVVYSATELGVTEDGTMSVMRRPGWLRHVVIWTPLVFGATTAAVVNAVSAAQKKHR